MKNKSYAVTAEVAVTDDRANGVIVAQGGAFGGWSPYMVDGVPTYCYNLLGLVLVKAAGSERVPAGTHQIRVKFACGGEGLAEGGDTTLFVDGERVGSARQEASIPMLFAGDETLDIGSDHATSVSDDYRPETSQFTGDVHWVQLDQGLDDQSRLITPEDRMKVAMMRH